MKKRTIIFVANRGFALYNSRLMLMRHFLRNGWNVIAITGLDRYTDMLKNEGISIEPIHVMRGNISIINDLKLYLRLKKIYKQYDPTLIHHFHSKPVILGTLAGRKRRKFGTRIVNTITGIGNAINTEGKKKIPAGLGYKLAISKNDRVVFQNADDLDCFHKSGWVQNNSERLIVSSGVDIHRFSSIRNRNDRKNIKILMISRLLWQKGVGEFLEAARLVKKQLPNVEFLLAGEFDSKHPDAVSESALKKYTESNIVKFLGYIDKPENLYHEVDLFVFPSYYREGVPRVVLEAAACNLPVIGCDVPGTREAIIDGKTGYLVNPKNIIQLAKKITELANDHDKRVKMGDAAHEFMKSEFDINIITEKYLDIYREVGIEI
ncbi:MAG: glycosyltransferase family 4 protein [Calditrichaceae bacterium]